MALKSETAFQDGDFVVYPTHGVGRILGTEEREVAGTMLEMLVVRFEQDRMTLRVPMEKAKSLGLRTLSSRRQMEQTVTHYKAKPKCGAQCGHAGHKSMKLRSNLRSGINCRGCAGFASPKNSPSNPIQSDRCIKPH